MKKNVMSIQISLAMVTLTSSISFGFGIAAKGILKTYGQPVHETMTAKAAIESGLLTNAQAVELKYLVEGVRFNDDPEGYLLEGAMESGQGGVVPFVTEFMGRHKESKENDPTKAAHFGDFQFLHAMGRSTLSADDIKDNIMLYAAHCWKMATDADSFAKFSKDYEFLLKQSQSANPVQLNTEERALSKVIKLFPQQVLFFHAKNQAQFQFRSLGSLLHVIQDSYSKGHVVRIGWETGDNAGKIKYFQDYSQQDSNEHSHLDRHQTEKLDYNNLFQIQGVSIAFERSKQLLQMAAANCAWNNGDLDGHVACEKSVFRFLDRDVFAFDENTDLKSRATKSHLNLIPKPAVIDESRGGP